MNPNHHAYRRIATRVRRQQWARKWTWFTVVNDDDNIVCMVRGSDVAKEYLAIMRPDAVEELKQVCTPDEVAKWYRDSHRVYAGA